MRVLKAGIALGLVSAALAGCGGAAPSSTSPPPPATTVSTITVTPSDTSVLIGARVRFTSVLRNSSGEVLTAPTVVWSTDNATVATVFEGTVTGVTRGTTTVRATSQGKTSAAAIRVEAIPIALLYITPGSAGLHRGGTQQLSFLATDSRGIPLTDRVATWTAENPGIATVSASGLVTAVANGRATITARVDDSVAHAGITVSDATVNFAVASMQVLQNTQTVTGAIPLLAGRATLVRVWVTGNPLSQAPIRVTLRLFRGGVLVQSFDQATPPVLSTAFGDRPLPESVNFVLPASLDLTGVSLQAVVDPDDAVAETDEFDNVAPFSGRLVLGNPVVMPPFPVVLMPILTGIGTDPLITSGQASGFGQTLQEYLPIPTAVPTIHGAFSYPVSTSSSSASLLLAQVEAVRVGEGSSSHYYGLISVESQSTFGVGGIGYWPGRSALGANIPSSYIIAHEVGHNLSLGHAPCGTSSAFDPTFPYLDGTIGVGGYDATRNTWWPASTYEMMSYCGSQRWISDYNYLRALNARIAQESSGLALPGAAGPGILVWGEVGGSGLITIQPVFALPHAVTERQENATGRADGFAADGTELFSMPLTVHAVADVAGESHFAIAIPLTPVDQQRLVRLRIAVGSRQATVTEPSGGVALREAPAVVLHADAAQSVLTWAGASYPGVMLRDRVSGEIVGFGSGGRLVLPNSTRPLDVLVSDGLRSQAVVIRP